MASSGFSNVEEKVALDQGAASESKQKLKSTTGKPIFKDRINF